MWECAKDAVCVSKFLIVDAFAGRTRIYDVRVGLEGRFNSSGGSVFDGTQWHF